MALVTLRPYPCPWAQCVETSWHSLYGGEGKDTLQVWGWALFMGDKKSKPWEISSQVSYLDQHILVHLGQITSTSSLFRAGKKYFFFFFLEMPNWHPHVFSPVKGDAVGVVLKNLTYHSLLLQVAQGTAQLLQTCCPSCMFTKKKKNFLKPGQKSWHFRERFFSKGGRRKMWRIMNSSSWKCTRQRSAQASIHGKWKESSHYCWDAQTQPR